MKLKKLIENFNEETKMGKTEKAAFLQEVSKFMSPNLEKWYEEVKERTKETPENEKASDSLRIGKNE